MTKTQNIDWKGVEQAYRAGIHSLVTMGEHFGVSDAGILKRARKEGWTRDTKKARTGLVSLTEERLREGFVYVIYLDDTAGHRLYKIGFSENFSDRFRTHQCASPFQMYVACVYFVSDTHTEEKALHDMFDERRVRGEWFRLTGNDLNVIAQRANLTNVR